MSLTVRSARKRFGTVQALDSASLELRSGELLGLLGPNGAGKTTLIRAIAGRLRLDEGAIEIDGEPIAPGVTGSLRPVRSLMVAPYVRTTLP